MIRGAAGLRSELDPDWDRRTPQEGYGPAPSGGDPAPRARWAQGALLALAPLAALGLQHLFRSTPTLREAPSHGAGPGAADSDFPAWVEAFTGATFREGNRVEVLLDGDELFPRLWADLEAAQHTIDFQI